MQIRERNAAKFFRKSTKKRALGTAFQLFLFQTDNPCYGGMSRKQRCKSLSCKYGKCQSACLVPVQKRTCEQGDVAHGAETRRNDMGRKVRHISSRAEAERIG